MKKRVLLIGQPNCGKSSIFNAIAGVKANSSHFPGTTVDILSSDVAYGDTIFEIVDLPGTYSLVPFDKAEEVVLKYLLSEKFDLIVNVMDASLLQRSLELTIELTDLKKPMIVVLNMMDEAEKKGILIDKEKLEEMLGVPVVLTKAIYGEGIDNLVSEIIGSLNNPKIPRSVKFSSNIESMINSIEKELGDEKCKRFKILKYFEWEKFKNIVEFPGEIILNLENWRKKTITNCGKNVDEIIISQRHHFSMKLSEEVSRVIRRKEKKFSEKLELFFYKPLSGFVIFVVSFVFLFYLVFRVGGFFEEIFLYPFDRLLSLADRMNPSFFKPFVMGLINGSVGAVGVVIPFLIPLVFLISLYEDSGYLARSAFLFDTFMHKIGLHGKSIPPLLLGFGCNVPAISATRIMESERDRIITALLVPFIPCSARTIIISALVASILGFSWAILVYIISILVTIILGYILSRFSKKPSPGLILEIPPFKFPSIKNSLIRTWLELKPFVTFAIPLLIGGSILLEYFTYFKADSVVNMILSPITHILDLPEKTGFALFFGFFRKELAVLMLSQSLGVKVTFISHVMSKIQILSFTIFTVLYAPCLATFLTIWKEFNSKIAWISFFLNTFVAIIITLITVNIVKFVGIL